MMVASSKLIKVLLHVFYFGGSLCTQSKKSLPSLVWSYLHLFQLRFDSITYRRQTTIACTTEVICPYRWLSDYKTKHSWLTYDYWLLLRNFAPVLVWNFYGDCLTDHVRLLAFAAKLCTSSGVKRLRWLPDWPRTTTSFCCESLHQFIGMVKHVDGNMSRGMEKYIALFCYCYQLLIVLALHPAFITINAATNFSASE